MIRKLYVLLALLLCVAILPIFTERVEAADDVKAITPVVLSNPGEIDDYLSQNKGLISNREKEPALPAQSLKLDERSWVILDYSSIYTENYSFDPQWNKMLIVSKSPLLASRIDYSFYAKTSDSSYRFYYYLDAGTYYIKDGFVQDQELSTVLYLYVLPNSAAISDSLVKSKDGNSYKETISTVPHFADFYLVDSGVSVDKYNDEATWKEAISTNDDKFTITANGEYTVKAVFKDSEWKDFPVMYSFSVYDIGKGGKTTDDDAKKTAAKLNKTSATIKVGESFKLKVTGAKVVSFKSSKKSVAKVSASGKVVGKKKGSATIKVTCDNGETYTCKVKVKK